MSVNLLHVLRKPFFVVSLFVIDHHPRVGFTTKRHANNKHRQKRRYHGKGKLDDRSQEHLFFPVIATCLNRTKENASRNACKVRQSKPFCPAKDQNQDSSTSRCKSPQIRIDNDAVIGRKLFHCPSTTTNKAAKHAEQCHGENNTRDKTSRHDPQSHQRCNRGIPHEKAGRKKTGKKHLPRVFIAAKHPSDNKQKFGTSDNFVFLRL